MFGFLKNDTGREGDTFLAGRESFAILNSGQEGISEKLTCEQKIRGGKGVISVNKSKGPGPDVCLIMCGDTQGRWYVTEKSSKDEDRKSQPWAEG